jgi:hypothetical protein
MEQPIAIEIGKDEYANSKKMGAGKDRAMVDRGELIFPTSMRHIFTKDINDKDYNLNKSVFNRRVVWNDTGNWPLGVVSPRYIPIPHTTVLEAMDLALKNGGYDAKNVSIAYSANPTRSCMTATIMGLDKVKMGDKGDEWQIGMQARSGMDGMHPIEYNLFLLREICQNGMALKKALGGVARKTHVGSLESITTFLYAGMGDIIAKIPLISDEMNTLERKRIAKKEFLEMVEKRFGKRFSNDVSDYMVTPAQNNPLYAVEVDTLSGYDALSLVTYVNQQRSLKLNYTGMNNRYRQIEMMVEGFQK